MTSDGYIRARSFLDRFVAGLLLVALSPLIACFCLIMLLTMGRPIFFRQERVGQNGRIFSMWKLRTMVRDAEKLGGGYAPSGLNLITPVGRTLRSLSLDEIPQLINILRGEMSFVGPRPALKDQYMRYTKNQAQRVMVPQGVTGLAQVRYRNSASWSTRIDSDIEYVQRVSFALDVKIILATIINVVRSDNVEHNQSRADVDDLERHERDPE